MKYICCVWLCVVWLVCHAQTRVSGLHIQKAPEIIQRITRQATRYGSAGTSAGSNYRPVASPASNYNVRNGALEQSSVGLAHPLSGSSGGQRTSGVGAFSFGGMASGRPTNGNSFAINTAPLGKVVNNAIRGGGGPIRPQSQPNQEITGGVGKPNQLQQALLQAAQYQLQQKQIYQQQQQQQQQLQQYPSQHQVQQPQHRRQVPPQQVYRQRPAASSYEYQQFN